MDRTMKYGGQCADGGPSVEVPIGWKRKIHHSRVIYISPSGSVLACLEQAKTYLLTDGTCKCGLECPLILHKVFNFDPGAAVKKRTAEDAKADSDVTKLCIHKRKIIAVATLHRSMESQFPSGATGAGHVGSLNHQAVRNDVHNGPSNSVTLDSKNPYKMPMSGQQYCQRDLGSPTQRELYTGHTRSRHGGGDHNSQRSPYRNRHSSLLSPPSSTSCSSQHYGDGTPSPRPDPLRSPDPSVLGFHGALSPGSGHMNGERFTPLSSPNIMVHGSPSGTQLSCILAGRTSVSLSPSVNAKSPNRQNSPCNFPQSVDFQHKSTSVCYTQQQPPISQLPPCVVQKKPVTRSEKDPLGILDPIPTKSHSRDQTVSTPSNLQFTAQPQVPSMNVNIPPAIVPLPSNLPLPMAKSGPIGHGQRVQHPTPSSVPSSPITSPVHMAGPAPIRVEETSHHSHTSISSCSQHGSCALTTSLQVSKLPSRSPRTSLPFHHLKETANQLLGVNAGMHSHPDSVCPPAPGSDSVSQSNHALGMTSNQLLDQQNPSSFPASSLLSAAAKAQLVNQNKLTDATLGTEARATNLGHPGLVGGRKIYSDGYGISDPKYLHSSGHTLNDSQSGRAALRDKLMAQQREVLRKRKQPNEAGGSMTFNMNIQCSSGSSSAGYPEPMKRLMQQRGASSNTAMAHLLQSMSHQSVPNGLIYAGHHPARSGKSPFFEESVLAEMPASQSVHGPHQLHSRVEIPSSQNLSNECNRSVGEPLNMDQFTGPINKMHNPGFGGNLGTLGYGVHEAVGSMGNPNPHWQQFGHHVKQSQGNIPFRDRTGLPSVMSNGGFNTFSESGNPLAHYRLILIHCC
ncbi:methyl-CpG-binding domain protein 5-like isoform X1 [Centroberyx gerrardi]